MGSIGGRWHERGPAMDANGWCNVEVSGTSVRVYGNCGSSFVYSGSYYNYTVYGWVDIDGAGYGDFSFFGGSGSSDFDTGWIGMGAGDHTAKVKLACGDSGCSIGAFDQEVFSEGFHIDDPERPATNVSSGVVHTSKGDGAMISASLGHQVWFDWWGQANGYPWKNEIAYFNVDCSKTNDVNAASSVSETDHYSQNTHINASTLKSRYGMNDGDSLYCWVNTCTNGAGWLGRVYLGKFTLQNPVNVKIDSCTQIVKMGNNLSLKYTLSDCNTAIDWTKARIYNTSGTLVKTVDLSNTSLGTKTVNVSTSGLANGTQYSIAVRASDNWQEVESSKVTFYTYQEPKMNNSISATHTTQSATMSNKFTISGTNNRAWSSLENEFQTRYRLKVGSGSYGSWTNLGNITEWSRTAAQMRTLVPKANDGTDITIQMERYSPSASWESTNKPTVTFKVYYRPRNGISDASYKFTNSSGSAVAKLQRVQKDKNIYASWTYDTTVANAGYVQGYRVRLYNSSGTVVKTYYTTNESTKNYTIPIGDIPQGQNTKIDITPYFKNDSTDTSQYWYYNSTISKINFVFVRRGYLYYKDSSGNWHDCGYLYEKDGSGTERHCQTLYVKDSSGTQHIIDLY